MQRNVYLYILGMWAISYAIRVLPLTLIRREITNRTVRYTELDVNGHMNNARYLDWLDDLLTADFHQNHTPREFTVCYLSEAREGETIELNWELNAEGVLRLDASRLGEAAAGRQRVFAAQALFGDGVL